MSKEIVNKYKSFTDFGNTTKSVVSKTKYLNNKNNESTMIKNIKKENK